MVLDTMRAVFMTGPGAVAVSEVPVPKLRPGGALVRVQRAGICGSDLHFYRGEIRRDAQAVIPGHEIAGEVVALAADADTGVSIGDRVCIEPLEFCRHCAYCRSGLYQNCPSRRFLIGGMAEYFEVPAYGLYPLPAGMDFAIGALAEPAAVAVHGLRLAGLSMGERVAVQGCGTIGLLTVLAARAAGAGEIIVTARYPQQRDMALALGADRVLAATPEAVQALAEEAASCPIDLVVETVGGTADTVREALEIVRPAGRICVLGVFSREVSFHPSRLLTKEARIIGSLFYGRSGTRSDFELALDLLAANADKLRPLVTHSFPLAEAGRAFATAAEKSTGAIKVQVAVVQ